MANVPAGFWRCVQTWSAHTPNTSFGMNVCPNSVGGVDVLGSTAKGTMNSTPTRLIEPSVPGS